MKNITSKIILITSLLMSGMANGQNFYTCVPKEDYIKSLAKQTKRTDDEIKRLARETRRSDEEVRNLARQVRRTDSEIENLIKSNAVTMRCGIYHLKNDKGILENMTGINIVKFEYEIFVCKSLYYRPSGESVYCNYNMREYDVDAKLVCYDKNKYDCDNYVEVCHIQ